MKEAGSDLDFVLCLLRTKKVLPIRQLIDKKVNDDLTRGPSGSLGWKVEISVGRKVKSQN
jgi:hypothetical protein